MINREQIEATIKEYEGQFRELESQIQQLEANYATQLKQATNTLNQIHGAIVALTQLVAAEDASKIAPQEPTDPPQEDKPGPKLVQD